MSASRVTRNITGKKIRMTSVAAFSKASRSGSEA